ncbi:molybdopterin-guanine dinucleotide biosynthesis protein MobA [Massilia sp. WF1]|uniref:nucleotidyltransferase family protein n=1 Tax=unclassified Massilia TaxID=2609279 RepID=UPI00064B1FAD|nr:MULTISPECIES: nucleotidyltransferase family protein [unclassified Massilia]ALK95639.1 molybdopterin-guanine dinucleotide biosynthesis protein MobA [Massilia sp. WG5]KLU35301.1 molybdopterin-guanine dinucleotide biosynthesis protein MobA [Massilia sp. WF1]
MHAPVVGILLAAGRGRRFDPLGQRNKLLQPLAQAGGEPVVVASARKLLAVLPRVIAVVPPDDGGVNALLAAAGCEVSVCPDADSGMAASLVHALRHSLSYDPAAWLVALGDMPYVAPPTLTALADALAAGSPIAAPVMGGRRGNPVGFGRVHLEALLALSGDQGARRLLQTCPVTELPVDDPGIFRDIDKLTDL